MAPKNKTKNKKCACSSSAVSAVEKMTFIHISDFKSSITPDNGVEDLRLRKRQFFKIGMPENLFDQVMQAFLRPENVVLRPSQLLP